MKIGKQKFSLPRAGRFLIPSVIERNEPVTPFPVNVHRFKKVEAVYEWKDGDYNDDFKRFINYRQSDNVGPRNVPLDRSTLKPAKGRNKFKRGMIVEAVDRVNPCWVAVATISAVNEYRVLVHFDGWSTYYDYWCRYDSPEIAAVGTCHRTGLSMWTPGTNGGYDQLWTKANGDWRRYAASCGGTLAKPGIFGKCVRAEQKGLMKLSEMCVRSFFKGIRPDVRRLLGSQEDPVLPKLPANIRKQLMAARMCPACGGAFFIGFQCVDAFTVQSWLKKDKEKRTRTFVTCTRSCGEDLVFRKRSVTDSNALFFAYPRLYAVPRPVQASN